MTKNNLMIRVPLWANGKTLWWLGKCLNKSENTVIRMLREELPEEEQKRILEVIEAHLNDEAKAHDSKR